MRNAFLLTLVVLAAGCESFDVPLELVVADGQEPLVGLAHLALTTDYGDGRSYTFVNSDVASGEWSLGDVPPGDVVLSLEGRVDDPVTTGNSLVVSSGRGGPFEIGPGTDVEADGVRILFTRRGALGRLSGALDDGLQHHALVGLADGGAVSFGGRGASEDEGTRKVLRFDVDGGVDSFRFREVGSMDGRRRDHAAVLLDDGRVLVVGTVPLFDARSSGVLIAQTPSGLEDARAGATPEIYDPSDDSLTPLLEPVFGSVESDMLVRASHTLTLLEDGTVLLAGGIQFDSEKGVSLSIRGRTLIIDPNEASLTEGPPLDTILKHTATRLQDGRVLVVGGRGVSGQPIDDIADAWIFDPAEGEFLDAGSIDPPRGEHGAALLPDGRVVVFGGSTDNGAVALADSWLFDPEDDSWSPGPLMIAARWNPGVAVTRSGRVLVCGGADEAGPVTGCELFVPDEEGSDGWVPAPDPGGVADSRDGALLVLLGTGDVLGVGGVSGESANLDLLLYKP
jgi:hypothetical protein